MNLESLCAPLSEDSPGGEDLVAAGVLNELSAFRILGQRVPLPGEGPPGEKRREGQVDWDAVQDRALAALARSRDLRVVPYLAAATLRLDGLTACLETLLIPGHWLEQFPDAVYPQFAADGRAQLNALTDLADRWAILEPIRWKALTPEAVDGSPSLFLLDLAQGRLPTKDEAAKPNEQRLRAMIEAADREQMLALMRTARAAASSLDAVISFFRSRLNVAPAVGRLRDELTRLATYLEPILLAPPAEPDVQEDAGGAPVKTAPAAPEVQKGTAPVPGETEAATGGARPQGPIKSREDAVRALEGVVAYFKEHEPSSVVPLLVERARRLVGRSFVEIVADIAPAALETVKSIGGITEAENAPNATDAAPAAAAADAS